MDKEQVQYTENPEIGELEVVDDFLPSPEELAGADEVVRVTLALSRNSVDFFKEEAAKHKTVYQRVIRRLLDEYVEQIQQRKPKP